MNPIVDQGRLVARWLREEKNRRARRLRLLARRGGRRTDGLVGCASWRGEDAWRVGCASWLGEDAWRRNETNGPRVAVLSARQAPCFRIAPPSSLAPGAA